MKIYMMAVLMVFISVQAMACDESIDMKNKVFKKYDTNKDGYLTAKEWKKINAEHISDIKFEDIIKYKDKDGDKKLSEEEFSLCLI